MMKPSANVLKSSDEVECGLLAIDWKKRTIEVRGAGGHDNDQMTPREVMRALGKKPRPDTTVYGLACWHDNPGGFVQICFYDQRDWESQVCGPE